MNMQINGKIRKAMSILTVVFLLSLGAFAQSNTGSITGVVTDPNGAVVPNATIKVTNQGTNESRTVQTDTDGRYEIPTLSNGVYKVTVTGSGFKETSVTDARLAVGDKLRVDVTMSIGTEAVVNVATQTATDTEGSTLGDTISSERINNNPINGRDFTQLLATVPGSVQTTNQFQTTINGIPSTFGGTSVLVDGVDAGRVDLNGTSNVLGRVESRVNRVSMDSIQEVQVVEQNYSAQYGDALGAVINPITKSGTNQFHGGFFDYFRNEKLDAGDALAGLQRVRLNQFGGNISGPIYKDKLFFFTNYEGVRQTRGQTFNVVVPTVAFRAAMVPSIKPVVSTLPLPQGPYIHTIGGIPNQVDPDLGRYSGQRIADLREDTGSIKVDWHQSEKSQFSVRYNINDSNTKTPYGVGSDQIADAKLRVQLFKVSHNYTIDPTSTNEFGFGINNNFTDVGAGSSTLPRFDFIFIDPLIQGIGPAQFDQRRTGNVYQFFDTYTKILGNHSIKAGGDLRLNRRSALSRNQDTLTFFSMSDFRTNAPFIVAHNGNPELNYANENYAGFINDDWKVHRRLTLNLGLRYELNTISREKNGLLQNFDVKTLKYTPVGQKIGNADKDNFGPRVGFAFDVFGKQKTVLRGGYGIFYNRELPASWGSPQANSFPQTSTDLFDLFDPLGCSNPPATFAYPVDPKVYACGQAAAFAVDPNIKTAMAQQWSLNVQQDIKIGTLTVGYVGNHVTHLLTDGVISPRNINRADAGGNRPLSNRIGDVFVVGGYPQSNYNAMQVNFRRNLSSGFRFNANYTWSHAIDDVVGFFKDYQNENDAHAERASSDQDVRHNFTLDIGYDLNFKKWFNGGPGWLVNGWSVNSITQARSGLPVTITRTGGIFSGFSFRPNVVPGVSQYCSNYNVPNCQFNAAAFSDPGAGVYGNAGRNILRGPHFAQVDMSLFKDTRLSEKTSVQLRMDVFNLFNHANYADPSGGISCSGAVGACENSFGKSLATVGNQLGGLLGFGGPRQIQLSARFTF